MSPTFSESRTTCCIPHASTAAKARPIPRRSVHSGVRIGFLLLFPIFLMVIVFLNFRITGEHSQWIGTPNYPGRAAKTRNCSNDDGPIIHACARFSLRYELPHILPWLFYHERLGISHFYLYFDPVSSDLNIPSQKQVYDIIAGLSFVTLYDMRELEIYEQWKALEHCQKEAHLRHHADWIIDFDIDEVFALGPPISIEPIQCNRNNTIIECGLVKWAAQLPLNILAVVVPRIDFGQNGHHNHPQDGSHTQMDLYTRRSVGISSAAKIFIRTLALNGGTAVWNGKHQVKVHSESSVLFPCGLHAKPASVATNGMFVIGMNKSLYPAQAHMVAPRLNHYSIRSLDECHQKLNDSTNATWFKEWGSSQWRTVVKDICKPNRQNDTSDFSLYCAGKEIITLLHLQNLVPQSGM